MVRRGVLVKIINSMPCPGCSPRTELLKTRQLISIQHSNIARIISTPTSRQDPFLRVIVYNYRLPTPSSKEKSVSADDFRCLSQVGDALVSRRFLFKLSFFCTARPCDTTVQGLSELYESRH